MIVKIGSDDFLVFIPVAAFLKWDSSRKLSPIENDLRTYFLIFVKDGAYLVHCRCLGNLLLIMDTLGLGPGQSASAPAVQLLGM